MFGVGACAAAQALHDVGYRLPCEACGANVCHRCEPPCVLEAADAEHVHRGAAAAAAAAEGEGMGVGEGGGVVVGAELGARLRHGLFEILTQGMVAYCPRGCPMGIVKSHGCNVMRCGNRACRVYFCYL